MKKPNKTCGRYLKGHRCDDGIVLFENDKSCQSCCMGCKHAIDMDCSAVCKIVAEHYHPEEC